MGHGGPVWSVAVKKNILVSGSQDKAVKIFSLALRGSIVCQLCLYTRTHRCASGTYEVVAACGC